MLQVTQQPVSRHSRGDRRSDKEEHIMHYDAEPDCESSQQCNAGNI